MAQMACERCKGMFSDAVLLYHDTGRICADCEAVLDEQQIEAGRIRTLIIGGPILAFASMVGVLGGIIPFLGMLLLLVTPFLAFIGVVQGVRAIMAGIREPDLSSGQKTGLFVSGGLTLLWCLPIIPVSMLFLIGLLIALTTSM